MLRYLIPLVLFLALAVFLAIGLTRDPHELTSVLINQPAPAFRLPELKAAGKTISNKDMREDAIAWLEELGDPYTANAVDFDGRTGIDYGVYGAPETYVIDQGGMIRMKHVGPITPDVWSEKILPVVQQLNRQGTSK